MRRAILLILQNPQVVATLEPEQYDFDAEMPGAKLLMKLIGICDNNPTITSGTLVEHFRDTDDWMAIDKLATTTYFPDGRDMEENVAIEEFAHYIKVLNKRSEPREVAKIPFSSRTGLLSLRRDREKDD